MNIDHLEMAVRRKASSASLYDFFHVPVDWLNPNSNRPLRLPAEMERADISSGTTSYGDPSCVSEEEHAEHFAKIADDWLGSRPSSDLSSDWVLNFEGFDTS